eukprot:m.25184 g.25184  ORF g.25184 m.25184 type:complete len:150 (+) comp7682_c0_seq1:230-679(+)
MYYKGPVLWPFGFGLSYTTFTYDVVSVFPLLSPTHTIAMERLNDVSSWEFSVKVRNTGNRDGDAVVLGFLKNITFTKNPENMAQWESLTREPHQRLFDFERIHVPQGGVRHVKLSLNKDDNGKVFKHSGGFTISIGDTETPSKQLWNII